jgi:hypothetical protein
MHACMYVSICMDAWMDRRMDGWMDGRMDGWMGGGYVSDRAGKSTLGIKTL